MSVAELLRCPVAGCHGSDGKPRELDGAWVCTPCQQRSRRALGDLVRVYIGLRTTDEAGAVGERITGGDEGGAPINLHHRVLATRICTKLVGYEDVVRTRRHLSVRPLRVREGFAVAAAVRMLTAHDTLLLADPYYGPEYADDLLRLKRTGWSALRWGVSRVGVHMPCPQCKLRALERFQGYSDFVNCRACGARWDEAGYTWLVRVMLHEHGQGATT